MVWEDNSTGKIVALGVTNHILIGFKDNTLIPGTDNWPKKV